MGLDPAAASAGVDLFAPFATLLAGAVPPVALAFEAGRECLVFPRYLLSPAYRSVGGIAQAVRDLCDHQGREWRHPGFLRLILGRLYRVRRRLQPF